MQFDLGHILHSMGLLSRVIAGVLLVMAILSIGVTIERAILLQRSKLATGAFLSKVREALDVWDIDSVLRIAKDHPRSFMAKRASERRRDAMAADMRKGMSIIATVGSVAPFVGLLGTVIGIITAFQGIGGSGSAGLGAVGAGIAEALVETAFGLMVAIPAVLFFNALNTRINADEAALERFAGELLDEMENAHGLDDSGRFAKAA